MLVNFSIVHMALKENSGGTQCLSALNVGSLPPRQLLLTAQV